MSIYVGYCLFRINREVDCRIEKKCFSKTIIIYSCELIINRVLYTVYRTKVVATQI